MLVLKIPWKLNHDPRCAGIILNLHLLQSLHVTGEGLYVLPKGLHKKHSLNAGCMQEMVKCLGAPSTVPAVISALSYSSSDGDNPLVLQRKKWVQLDFIFISALGAPGNSDIGAGRKGNNLCQVNAHLPLFSNPEQGKIKVYLVIPWIEVQFLVR